MNFSLFYSTCQEKNVLKNVLKISLVITEDVFYDRFELPAGEF